MKPVEANGSQTAVLLVKTLDGQSIEEYCADVFSKWKIGSKKKEDGLLLVIATADHKLRIHTGYGTESKVVDAQAFEIIQQMKVFLMKKDFYSAVNVFIDASQTLMKKD